MSFTDRVVIVTGAGRGIGRATAAAFIEAGATVVPVEKDEESLESLSEDLAENNGRLVDWGSCDVTDEKGLTAVIERSARELGRLDVLVNNAAVCPPGMTVLKTSPSEWRRILETNLTAAFVAARAAIPLMRELENGVIINVASVHALSTLPGYAAYAAAKGGLISLTRSIALEHAADGIRANAVLPGAIHTNMLEANVPDDTEDREEIVEAWNRAQPLGRVGQPDEIADCVLFLASERSSFATGASFVIDGGMMAEL